MHGQTGLIIKPTDTRLTSKAYADLTGFDTATAFTVTGVVEVLVYAVVGATAIQSTSGTTTLEVGVSGSTALLIAQTTIDNSDFGANTVWIDNNPDVTYKAKPTTKYILGNGNDIVLTRSADDITQGTLTIYVEWIPKSSDGNVVAA